MLWDERWMPLDGAVVLAAGVCCRSALASASLEPQVVQQLCRSLPHDLLKDFPPSLLLLLHEQQQQRHQKDEAEQTSLLWGLAAALQKRCSGWKGTPFCAAQSAPATDVKAASTEGAASVPDFAVAVLEAQTKILHKLREVYVLVLLLLLMKLLLWLLLLRAS